MPCWWRATIPTVHIVVVVVVVVIVVVVVVVDRGARVPAVLGRVRGDRGGDVRLVTGIRRVGCRDSGSYFLVVNDDDDEEEDDNDDDEHGPERDVLGFDSDQSSSGPESVDAGPYGG